MYTYFQRDLGGGVLWDAIQYFGVQVWRQAQGMSFFSFFVRYIHRYIHRYTTIPWVCASSLELVRVKKKTRKFLQNNLHNKNCVSGNQTTNPIKKRRLSLQSCFNFAREKNQDRSRRNQHLINILMYAVTFLFQCFFVIRKNIIRFKLSRSELVENDISLAYIGQFWFWRQLWAKNAQNRTCGS